MVVSTRLYFNESDPIRSAYSVVRYYATPATSQFRNSLSQGVVLTDSRNLGAQYIQAHLHRLFPIPRWTWIARELPNNQYLIAPPDLEWRNAVLRERQLLLGDIPFPVQAYEFTRFNNGRSLKNYWVQIYDYPHDLWRKPELSQLARDLGGILIDTDPRSLEHTSLAHTRIKIAVPDKEVIPACRNLIFTDTNGEMSTYLIQTIVEDDDPLLPWGYSRSQHFSLTRKRSRSPSPPRITSISSFQPIHLHASNLPEPPPLAPIPAAPTDIAPPLARLIPPTSQPLTILPPSDALLPNPTAPPPILLDHPPKPPVLLESPLPHPDPLPDGPPTLEASAPVQLTEPDVVPTLETVPPPETLIASAEIPSEIPAAPAALDPTPATVTATNRPAPSQDRGKGQPTASEEARHSLRLKVKEGTAKKRGGKSGASSGNVIISSFPYIHLSDSELIQLYDISGFHLGSSEKEKLDAVTRLRALSHSRFLSSFSDVLSSKPSVPSSKPVDLRPLLFDNPLDDTQAGNIIIPSGTDTSEAEDDTWDSEEEPCLGLEGPDLSDLLRDRAATFFHSSDITTHTSSSSVAS
ncbi:hypothetical protein FCM35_KLT00235 [Carex littledalei]|uniref:Uncharacterized protein n=1 Tax=Carex littledalei TaxID=544730 RepID=A0A833RJ09_9POAL|nr:hypothetical protein FCM35_KLT00235 [Carex littledalei]